MATVTKRGKYWRAQIRRLGFPPQHKSFDTHAEAEAWARAAESEMDRGIFVSRAEAERTTLAEALERYKTAISSRKAHPAQDYQRISHWLRQPLAHRYLANLKGADFAQYRDMRRALGRAENTVRLELALVSHLFEIARKEWGMESLLNPLKNITKPSGSRERDRRLVAGEFERIADALTASDNPWVRPAFDLAIETSLRQGMLVQLRWEWVDLERQTVTIPVSFRRHGNKSVPAVLPLSLKAVSVLKALPQQTTGPILETTANAIRCIWKRTLKALGIENLRWHDLRHEAASRFFEKGLHPLEVASITGHKSLTMLRRYTHLQPEGVKTKVLMLSATPVNNRLADLKNQIAFVTEGRDDALAEHGLPSVETTVRLAQGQFNRWQQLEETERRPARLMDMLGFDYFRLLDLLTIARSRKHIEKYYGTSETGQFPKRLRPINVKADVDSAGLFPPIGDINTDIRRLNLSAYAPLRYVLPAKQAEYDAKYSVAIRGGESIFRQVDREESLIHLMRVNLLKRMESSVHAFALTVERQLADVNGLLTKLNDHVDSIDEVSIEDVEVDNPEFESLLVGRKVKVLLQDVDRIRWRQDLTEDRNRLATLLSNARAVDRTRDAKLAALRALVKDKVAQPINTVDGRPNRKLIIFTAFADTALYLYDCIADWARTELGLHGALVTGSGSNKTNLPGLRTDLPSVLTAFAPKAKERPGEFADEGELDLLIATDCISEGQNLQDGDYLVNYDIHWNPVRIIQRFGRIDRIGSPNAVIQLVNFWPNMALDEYIGLEQRVSGRMVLLDISATGEENLIERDAGNLMNDLEYRRKQLQKLQEAVIDLEDLSSGISIADLTLADYRIELAGYLREHPGRLAAMPLGVYAVTSSADADDVLQPGAIFCLRAVGDAALATIEPGYPLAPHYVVHVSSDGAVQLPHSQAKQVLDRLKGLCLGRDLVDAQACERFGKATKAGRQMQPYQALLQQAIASVVGKSQERAVASLFSPGGTHAKKGEFAGMGDFDVVAFLVIV